MELLHYLDETDDRKIIWIYGRQGNEGKSFFQKYIFSVYGTRRVSCMSMLRRSEDMFHALSEQTLTCKDIFLFNLSRNKQTAYIAYDVLEGIKDGEVISPKYDSRLLKFKTLNVVMIFSNDTPTCNTLSNDR